MTHSATRHTPRPLGLWLSLSGLLFVSFFVLALSLVMLFNGGWVNHVLTPVAGYLSLFQLIWPEQPLGALQFILSKSFLAFAHRDAQTGLNIWTLEYDALSLGVYALAALLGGRLLAGGRPSPTLYPALGGMIALLLSVTYMTAIEHCAGPTWIGFVLLYGLGFGEFELTPLWQLALGGLGLGLLVRGLLRRLS